MPVALNLYKIRVAKDAGGDFFRKVQRQRPAQYQGLYVVAADAKVLGSHQNFKSAKTWPQEVLADLGKGLKAFGRVTPRRVKAQEPLPFPGAGVQKDGRVSLALYARGHYPGASRKELGTPTLDSVTLSAKEWATLAPAWSAAGAAWNLPRAVAQKLGRALSPSPELLTAPLPAEVTTARVGCKVHKVENGITYLTYEGQLEAPSHKSYEGKRSSSKASLTGTAAYDAKTKELLSLTLVFDGVHRNVLPYDQGLKFGAVVEWRRKGGGK